MYKKENVRPADLVKHQKLDIIIGQKIEYKNNLIFSQLGYPPIFKLGSPNKIYDSII